jgi:hypothetical protein
MASTVLHGAGPALTANEKARHWVGLSNHVANSFWLTALCLASVTKA